MSGLLRLICLLTVVLASGCASFGSYTISEGDLERYMKRQVDAFDQSQLAAGSPLSVGLRDVDIELGPDDRDVAVLDVSGEVALTAMMMKLPVDVSLKLEGAPVYSSKDRAVYIRRLRLLDSRIDSPYFQGDLKPVTATMMRMLGQMLETMPVYRLDENDFRQRLLGSVPMDIKVGRGKLIFVPAE